MSTLEPQGAVGDAMAKLVAEDELYRLAARVAWETVLDSFARKLSVDAPEVQAALTAYRTARALQVATADKMLQLVQTSADSSKPD